MKSVQISHLIEHNQRLVLQLNAFIRVLKAIFERSDSTRPVGYNYIEISCGWYFLTPTLCVAFSRHRNGVFFKCNSLPFQDFFFLADSEILKISHQTNKFRSLVIILTNISNTEDTVLIFLPTILNFILEYVNHLIGITNELITNRKCNNNCCI